MITTPTTYLVTGGAGFIGSHLCNILLDAGHNVYCLDNFCDFYSPAIKRANIESLLDQQGFKLLEGDIRDTAFLEKVFSAHSFDTVVHLAAMAGVRPSINNPQLYYEVNITGTFNLLEAIVNSSKVKETPLPRFLFASSSSVYGNNEKVPFSETDPVDNPISPYAVTKKAGELICYNYHHLHHLSVLCLRFFTVYGPRQRPDLAIHKFSRMILNQEPLPFYGDGSTLRDYTYIDDIIQGVVKAINYITENDQPATRKPLYDIFNLGESRTISLSRMVQTIEAVLGKKAILNRLPLQPGDVNQTYADISKSRSKLGYNPACGFEEGVAIFAEWLHTVR